MATAEFNDPRLVAVYDVECRWGPDDDLFLAVVGETPAARVLDLGCGTGRLTLALAAAGHSVTGVDPAAASLAAARAKRGADRVTWVHGTAADVPSGAYDVIVMSAHVAQFVLDEWPETLAHLVRALVPGGRLVFDSRDPQDRGWERWNPVESRKTLLLPDGPLQLWDDVTSVVGPEVSFTRHYEFADGAVLLSRATMRFRSRSQLEQSLQSAGFAVEQVWGGWHREPVGQGDGELVVVATR